MSTRTNKEPIIKVLVKENPRRRSSFAYKRFSTLMQFNNKPVSAYRQTVKEKNWVARDLRWAVNKKWIKLAVNKKELTMTAN